MCETGDSFGRSYQLKFTCFLKKELMQPSGKSWRSMDLIAGISLSEHPPDNFRLGGEFAGYFPAYVGEGERPRSAW